MDNQHIQQHIQTVRDALVEMTGERDGLLSVVSVLKDRAEQQQREIERLRSTLSWYADKSNYSVNLVNQWGPYTPILNDDGFRATSALSPKEDQTPPKCPDCNGEGGITVENFNDPESFECPTCEGTGVQMPPTECMSCDGSGWVYDYERTGVPEQSACTECKGREVSTDVQDDR